MSADNTPRAAIVDYGLGNLFSVRLACESVGMRAEITSSKKEALSADLVILPGVGAFGDAMAALERLDLVSPLRDLAASGRFLMGVCLGMQLLMSESYEFGRHQGLNIVEGPVIRFDNPMGPRGPLKVPQVGWNRIFAPQTEGKTADPDPWRGTPLSETAQGENMYFVHSFHVRPTRPDVALSLSRYGDIEFCSGLKVDNVFAVQFHPERSGPQGLRIYAGIASLIQGRK